MNRFKVISTIENHFIKSNSNTLKELFGSDDLMPFWIADMDFKIANPITKKLQELISRGIYAYEDNSEALLKAITNWYNVHHQLELIESNFLPVTNVLTGISLLIQELSLPNESILIQTPVYHKFSAIIEKTGRTLVYNPLKLVNGTYQIDFDDLEKKLSSQEIRLFILCNPHNPVGRVWSKYDLQKIIYLADKYGTIIISDEMHSDIVYKGSIFTSILAYNNPMHIALIGSPAKTFGMQSISNGYIYIRNPLIHQKIKQKSELLFLHTGNAFTTVATITAYTEGKEWLSELLNYLERNIAWINNFLISELPQIKLIRPEATYQIWLDFRELNLSDIELQFLLTEKAKIALALGHWFGKEGEGFARMTIATPLENIQNAFLNLKKAVLNMKLK